MVIHALKEVGVEGIRGGELITWELSLPGGSRYEASLSPGVTWAT